MCREDDYAHLIRDAEAELRAESAARQCPCKAHLQHKQCDSYCDCYDLEEWNDKEVRHG